MATFIILRHPVTILVTAFTNPDSLTNDLSILIPLGLRLVSSMEVWKTE